MHDLDCKEVQIGQELYALNDKIASAKSILDQYEMAFGKLNKEFNSIRQQINGMTAMVEQFKVSDKVYLEYSNYNRRESQILFRR